MGGFRPSQVFLSTPVGLEFEALRRTLQDMLTAYGLEAVSYQTLVPGRSFTEQIREQIRQSSCMIADLTGPNTNVIYEVGLAHGAGIPVFLLTRSLGLSTPAFLRDNLFLVYQPENLEPVLSRIAGWLQGQASRSGSVR